MALCLFICSDQDYNIYLLTTYCLKKFPLSIPYCLLIFSPYDLHTFGTVNLDISQVPVTGFTETKIYYCALFDEIIFIN